MRPELPPGQIAETAQTLKADPNVKAAIERALEKRGLDEASKAHFVSILWRFAESTDVNDEKKTLAAWRILGRGFIIEKLEVDKPETLPLAGLEAGLKRMGLVSRAHAEGDPLCPSWTGEQASAGIQSDSELSKTGQKLVDVHGQLVACRNPTALLCNNCQCKGFQLSIRKWIATQGWGELLNSESRSASKQTSR